MAFATSPDLWPYSNYAEWVGTRKGTLVDKAFIGQFYPERDEYKQSVLGLSDQHQHLAASPDPLSRESV